MSALLTATSVPHIPFQNAIVGGLGCWEFDWH